MAHFAKVNSKNIVEDVLVVPNEQEHRGEQYLNDLGLEGRWIQTSYNSNIRRKYAGIGDEYFEAEDGFRSPAPFPSWVFNSEAWKWEAPVPKPDDGADYEWDEESQSWIVVEEN